MFFFDSVYPTVFSCKSVNYDDKVSRQINRRIEILENSFKFSIIPENLYNKSFDKIKSQIEEIYDSNSNFKDIHEVLKGLFLNFDIEFAEDSKNQADLKFNVIIGLDNLIFKYLVSRISFSEYKLVVVPNKNQIVTGDTLRAKIYLTATDSLYAPEFIYLDLDSDGNILNTYYLPNNNGVGEFNMVTRMKGKKKLSGFGIYSNELGLKDTLHWTYEFEVY